MTAYSTWSAFRMVEEGPTSDDPHDPGGLTVHGIILADLRQWAGLATRDDLLRLTPASADGIAYALYWLPMRGDSLPPGVAMMVADHGFVAGVGTSVRILQRTLGFTVHDVDGICGRMTCAAAAALDQPTLIDKLRMAQAADFASKANAQYFLHGWDGRLDRCHAIALTLSGA